MRCSFGDGVVVLTGAHAELPAAALDEPSQTACVQILEARVTSPAFVSNEAARPSKRRRTAAEGVPALAENGQQ